MPHSPAEIIRHWFELVWNEGRHDLVHELCAADVRMSGLDETGGHTSGPDAFLAFYERLRGAMPDIRFTVHEVVGDDEIGAGRWEATATHSGHQLGVPPTGNTVTVTGMSFVRMRDGRVIEAWNEWDRMAMARAIGVMGATPPA